MHININIGNALLVTMHEMQQSWVPGFIYSHFSQFGQRQSKYSKNSFYLTSNNSEIPVICHLKRVVPRARVLLFTRNKAPSMRQAYFRGILKMALSPSICRISWLLVSYNVTFLSYEDSKQQKEPWPSWTSIWSPCPRGTFLWLVVHPKYGSSNKKLPLRTHVSTGIT